jgi:hypothetical protein
MKPMRALAMVAASAVMLLLIGWGSRIHYQSGENEHGMLRLSWRMRGQKIEACRDRTPAELEALPVHMRTPRLCESRAVPYRLILSIDHGKPDTTTVLPAGAKHDRPFYILRDSLLRPGAHHVAVTFARSDTSAASVVEFNGNLNLRPGRIELITLTEDGRRLAHRNTHN